MFKQFTSQKDASTTIEYMALISIIILTFVIFGGYMTRGIMGRWKMAGETFGTGVRYDGFTSTECVYDPYFTNRWYNLHCFDDNCDCRSTQATTTTCEDCIVFTCNAIECS